MALSRSIWWEWRYDQFNTLIALLLMRKWCKREVVTPGFLIMAEG
jgi:hypothetical protein